MPSLPAATQPSTQDIDQLRVMGGRGYFGLMMRHVNQMVKFCLADGVSKISGVHGRIIALFKAQTTLLVFFVSARCVFLMSLNGSERFVRPATAGLYAKCIFQLAPLMWLTTLVAMGCMSAARRWVVNTGLVLRRQRVTWVTWRVPLPRFMLCSRFWGYGNNTKAHCGLYVSDTFNGCFF